MDATLVLGKQGRLVIPADIRASLGLEAGDELQLRLEDRRIVIQRSSDAATALRGFASSASKRRSLVDELLADRRHEVAG